ncbi:hypothetical protein DPV78_012710 [Talaromyces pinophilus]|nr:hypothetical protein DPV78_012710 [Talaromyces pinophilus]
MRSTSHRLGGLRQIQSQCVSLVRVHRARPLHLCTSLDSVLETVKESGCYGFRPTFVGESLVKVFVQSIRTIGGQDNGEDIRGNECGTSRKRWPVNRDV